MENKQLGSVEWLISQQKHNKLFDIETIEQAKAMHKEEIKNAHTIGYVIGGGNGYIHEPEQYYNETFGGNK